MLRDYKYSRGKEKEIPFFPLSIIVSPGEKIPLRIFEPRYIELIKNIENSGEPFAIPYVHESKITGIGSIVKLKKITNRYPDGQMIISIEGLQFCEILDFKQQYHGKLYSGGYVLPYSNIIISKNPNILFYVKLLEWDNDETIIFSQNTANILGIIDKLHLISSEKFIVLSQRNIEKTENILISYLKYYKLIFDQEKQLDNNFEQN